MEAGLWRAPKIRTQTPPPILLMQMEFNVTFEDDAELVWQNDGTARRVVIRNFELWVPSL